MRQDITFDQYHYWLERRLEQNGDPDQHDSPGRLSMKTDVVESSGVGAAAADAGKIRISLTRMF